MRSNSKESPLRRREIASRRSGLAFLAMTKALLLFGYFVLFFFPTIAISQNSDIVGRSFHAGDSVMLRWAPSSYSLWQHGNAVGYKITRFGLDEYLDIADQDFTGKGTVIALTIKPLVQNDTAWSHLAKTIPQSNFVFSSIYIKEKPPSDPKKKEQAQNITHGFSLKVCDDHVEVAKAAGLFFTDHTAKKGEQYIYRIEFVKPTAANTQNPAVVSADEKNSILPTVGKPSAQFRSRSMRMTFDVALSRGQYSGFIIERSEDSVRFSRINPELLSFVKSQYELEKHELVYEDSIPMNGKTYWYRVRGFSYFGMVGPPSATVRGKGKEEWNAYPVPDTIYSPDNKKVILRWSIPTLSDPSKLQGICVLRNDKVSGHYTPLSAKPLLPKTNSYTDTSAGFTNYYILAAISTDGDTAFSFPVLAQLQDNDPPSIPKNITGTIDTNGIVRVKWEQVSSTDLKGYRVFRCNSLREEFVEISDSVIRETSFTDTITLETLTRHVYYSVRSVDRVWNNSDFSVAAKLQRPDRIAPVAPLVKAIYHTDSTIALQWINSSSDDIATKRLVRTSSSGKVVIKTYAGQDTTSVFIDANIEPGNTYTYEIAIADSSHNTSTLTFPPISYAPRVRPALKNFTATPDLEKRTITLTWDLPSSPVDRIIIYKGKGTEAIRSFKTLNGTTTQYIDNQLYTGNPYTYRIKCILKDGAETRLAEARILF